MLKIALSLVFGALVLNATSGQFYGDWGRANENPFVYPNSEQEMYGNEYSGGYGSGGDRDRYPNNGPTYGGDSYAGREYGSRPESMIFDKYRGILSAYSLMRGSNFGGYRISSNRRNNQNGGYNGYNNGPSNNNGYNTDNYEESYSNGFGYNRGNNRGSYINDGYTRNINNGNNGGSYISDGGYQDGYTSNWQQYGYNNQRGDYSNIGVYNSDYDHSDNAYLGDDRFNDDYDRDYYDYYRRGRLYK